MRMKIAIRQNNKVSRKNLNRRLDISKDKMFPKTTSLPQIMFISTIPPRECGIATYAQDLITSLNNKFEDSFDILICALENNSEKHNYPETVSYVLETEVQQSYLELANQINSNSQISMVLIQHEFGLFKSNEADFLNFLKTVNKPIIIAFHTVLPVPDDVFKNNVLQIEKYATSIIVMTNSSAKILNTDYGIASNKIEVIQHGTHLVEHSNKNVLKEKYNYSGRKIIATFGLLSSGKCIETSLNALREIRNHHPEVLFLIIGKTHPNVVKIEGEKYRQSLESRIFALNLQNNVQFINQYLPLSDLLEYLQLTDIYLFTSNDRNQAVSGTFSYAISCGCPIISTPIPHAVEVLKDGHGIIVDFENPTQLSQEVIRLFNDAELRKNMASQGIHKFAPTAWENSALAHALLFEKLGIEQIELKYKLPAINLNHVKNLTTDFAMIQFSNINQPDLASGYTLDDNARALVSICQHYQLTRQEDDLDLISKYFKFIQFCLQPEGYFLNYVDVNKKFTKQNSENLADANGRAIWALGYLVSISKLLPLEFTTEVQNTFQAALAKVSNIHSPRAMAFIIKGIYYSTSADVSGQNLQVQKHLADKLVKMYKYESKEDWQWFESYMTYGNSILPEAMLCAHLNTGDQAYKQIAVDSFNFLLNKIFVNNEIHVISNKGWLHNNNEAKQKAVGGEQPIDVTYTILALSKFYEAFENKEYLEKMTIAFDWFLGKNHLRQIIYNPCTGGCYDGLEDTYVNLNQGAESTVSYLMARLTMEKQFGKCNEKVKYNHSFANHMNEKLVESI